MDRLTIASDIKNNSSYVTIQNSLSSWKKGKMIRIFRIKGEPYLRIDDNKVALDNLGELPEVNFNNLPLEEQKKLKNKRSLKFLNLVNQNKSKNLKLEIP